PRPLAATQNQQPDLLQPSSPILGTRAPRSASGTTPLYLLPSRGPPPLASTQNQHPDTLVNCQFHYRRSRRPARAGPTPAASVPQQHTEGKRLPRFVVVTSRSVRIVIDYRPALNERSGVGEYTHQLVAALLALPANGSGRPIDLTLFSSSWKDRLTRGA